MLVVRGEAGIGKSVVLAHARDSAVGSTFRVESAIGVESETQFAFAGLHQLCAPMLDRIGALPEPQQDALGVALGLRAGAPPDRFLVGLAALNLLAEVAEDGPLACLVDDAHWLDQASAEILAFVARRMVAERVVLVFALRDDDGGTHPVDGLPELRLGGLDDDDARTLLADCPATLHRGVLDRILAEARGNPLALLELPRNAEAAGMAGGFERPDRLSVPRRVEDTFQRRTSGLPPDTRVLLLVAAADPTGDAALLWRAAEQLAIGGEAVAPAEAAGLVEIDSRVRFRHPLVRSAVYRAAVPAERRRVHQALASATDPHSEPDRRAWHRAQAVLGADEGVAEELERSAERARGRGGLAAAAAFLHQAAELTPEHERRAERALEAASAKYEAGAFDAARSLLAEAAEGSLDELRRGRLALLRGRVALHPTAESGAPGMLLDAARTLAPLDAALSRETYLHALDAAVVLGAAGYVSDVAEAARTAPPPRGRPRPVDLLLDGLATTYSLGFEAGAPGLRRALEAFRGDGRGTAGEAVGDGGDGGWLLLAMRTAVALFDDETADVLADRNVRITRDAGALATLPAALIARSAALVLTGKLAEGAAELDAEGVALMRATGAVPTRYAQLVLAGWRGRHDETVALHAASLRESAGRGRGAEPSFAEYALAVLHNALGNYPTAMEAASRASGSLDLPAAGLALAELVEAAVLAGEPDRATDALAALSSRARASGTPWALGLAARSRALTTPGLDAEKHHLEAIEWFRGCRMAGDVARAHLVYGEWLRRHGRRQDAREQLRTAHEQLSAMGAEAFAARAARELRVTGEHPRKRTARPSDALTAHELHIARLVAAGATTREVAARLILSPRTIETHLRNIFRKLGITSRRQLRDLWVG